MTDHATTPPNWSRDTLEATGAFVYFRTRVIAAKDIACATVSLNRKEELFCSRMPTCPLLSKKPRNLSLRSIPAPTSQSAPVGCALNCKPNASQWPGRSWEEPLICCYELCCDWTSRTRNADSRHSGGAQQRRFFRYKESKGGASILRSCSSLEGQDSRWRRCQWFGLT